MQKGKIRNTLKIRVIKEKIWHQDGRCCIIDISGLGFLKTHFDKWKMENTKNRKVDWWCEQQYNAYAKVINRLCMEIQWIAIQ